MKQGVWGESSKLLQRDPGQGAESYSIFLNHTLNFKYDFKKVWEPLLYHVLSAFTNVYKKLRTCFTVNEK